MEEATGALDAEGEQLILETLHRELPEATLVTISGRPGPVGLHHRELALT
jgi:putative ATP-binding cassette transporter